MAIEKIWLDKYREAEGCCIYCRKDMLADEDAYMSGQLDHLVPTEAGGPDTPENKVLACNVCNNLKGTFDPRSAAPARDAMIEIARKFIFACRATKAQDLAGYKNALKGPNKAPEPTP
jgi:hypothetical protein